MDTPRDPHLALLVESVRARISEAGARGQVSVLDEPGLCGYLPRDAGAQRAVLLVTDDAAHDRLAAVIATLGDAPIVLRIMSGAPRCTRLFDDHRTWNALARL